MYTDPITGFQVFTEAGLTARGRCCGSGCRHCPYQHERIPYSQRPVRIQRPALLSGTWEPGGMGTALVFRDGPDSRAALASLQCEVLLACPFDAFNRTVPAGLKVASVTEAALAFALPLLGVPIPAGRSFEEVMTEACVTFHIDTVVRGDLTTAEARALGESRVALVNGLTARTRDGNCSG